VLHRILDKVAEEVQKRGLVGEERLAQTLYLVLTSRLLDKRVSAGVKGHSASGKSYTVETESVYRRPVEFAARRSRRRSTEAKPHRPTRPHLANAVPC
jgi:hypothetical protein